MATCKNTLLYVPNPQSLSKKKQSSYVSDQSRHVFEFTEIDEIYPALLNFRCPTLPFSAKITHDHLRPLRKLAQDLKAGAQALENAYKLGTGYDDLAVVLLEPSDRVDAYCFNDMLNASMA